MAKKGIILTNDNFKYQQTIGIIATYPNIISYLHPSLLADKEGLFVFNNLLQNFERRELMRHARISRKTYNKCMKELQEYGYIRYEPSSNPQIGSKVQLKKL